MINAKHSLEVQAKAAKVWDILARIEAWPEWQATPYARLKAPPPIKEGSMFEFRLGGIKWKGVVTKAQRPQKLAWTSRALGLRATHEWDLQESDGMTIVETRASLSGWMTSTLLFWTPTLIQSLNERALLALKAIAESSQ